jgi:HD-GYP domain-containing protein (c-di-GMP phosphodiesterase class II)
MKAGNDQDDHCSMVQYEQKVSVDRLRVGMYVSRLDRPWLETRFLFQGFHINSEKDVKALRDVCEYVFVDPEKGEADAVNPHTRTLTPRKAANTDIFRNVPQEPVYPIVTSFEEELEAARESHAATLSEVSNIVDDLKAGRKIHLQSVRQAVASMIASIIRNPDAMFWLARLKDRDSYAYAHCVDASSLAVSFGRHLGFSRPDLENPAVGTLLFDIGKLQLPEGLLKKPGRLTEQELALIRRHVEFGVRIAS